MRSKPALWYEARLVFRLPTVLPLLALPAYAALQWLLLRGQHRLPDEEELVRVCEIIGPLAAGLAAANLMTIEVDEEFDELRRSYPEPDTRVPLLRTLDGLILALLVLLAGMAGFRLAFGDYAWPKIVLPGVAPALYLLGLSLLLGNLTRSYWVAAAGIMVYWFLELQSQGQLTGPLFLFAHSWPSEGVLLPLNRALLSGGALFFAVLNAWVAHKRRQGAGLRRQTLAHG